MKIYQKVFLCLLLSVILSSCGGGSSNGSSSISRNSCALLNNFRVISGTECDDSGSPIVLLSIAPPNDFVGTCTGTLISPNAVLTAGHCVPTVAEGTVVTVSGQAIPASRIIIHPGFQFGIDSSLIFNDIAIVVLSRAVTNATVPLVVSQDMGAGDRISIFGYGLDERGIQGTQRSGQMEISDVTETHIVAQFSGAGSNTCLGDSGGPALYEFMLSDGSMRLGIVGVVSTGLSESCGPGDATFFTRTVKQEIIDFIRANVPGVGLI